MNKNYDLIVIGGGAAGMMSAITAAEFGQSVLLLERNIRCGRKLAITGKGRCNVTNNCDNQTLLKNIPTNSSFLYSAFSRFTTQDTMDFFTRLGVPLKTERGNRVFPVSDKAQDIVGAMVKQLEKLGVTIITARAKKIVVQNNVAVGVVSDKGEFSCEKVILATGGKSYPVTGSTGDGYNIAKALGHEIIPPKPSLVPVETAENCAKMMGLSLKNVVLKLHDNFIDKTVFSEMGEMLFTHFGVSGPLVLSASSFIKDVQLGHYSLFIDLKPALDFKQLDVRVQRDFKENNNKLFANSLNKLLPEKLILPIIQLSEINPDTRVNEITREQRHKLVEILKAFPLTVVNLRPIEEAIITDGGISVKEINPKNMESKLIKNLHFAGEIIDCTGFTGGFNLQIAFATAYSASALW